MKNKILISLVACFIAAGSFLHFNLAQNNNNSDISLADISVMAQADGESGNGDCNLCVVKNLWGTIKYSCKPLHGTNNCSTSAAGHTLTCENATEEGCS